VTAARRKKGSTVGPRLRAECAILEAEGFGRTVIARDLNVGRETIRLLRHGDGGPLYESQVALARRRLAAGIPYERIISELTETLEPERELQPPTPEAEWAALRSAAALYGRMAAAYNVGRNSHFLETNPDRLIERAAEHLGIGAQVGAGKLELGHPEVDKVARMFLDLTLRVRTFGDAPDTTTPGAFVPWKPWPWKKE